MNVVTNCHPQDGPQGHRFTAERSVSFGILAVNPLDACNVRRGNNHCGRAFH